MLGRILREFAADDNGATAIEYALLGTLVAIALVASFTLVGDSLSNIFGNSSSGATGAISGALDQL